MNLPSLTRCTCQTGHHPDQYLIDLGKELTAFWNEMHRYENETTKDSGIAYERVTDAASLVARKIENQRATTLAGLKVKVRAIHWCHDDAHFTKAFDDPTTDIRLAGTIFDDLMAMESQPVLKGTIL